MPELDDLSFDGIFPNPEEEARELEEFRARLRKVIDDWVAEQPPDRRAKLRDATRKRWSHLYSE